MTKGIVLLHIRWSKWKSCLSAYCTSPAIAFLSSAKCVTFIQCDGKLHHSAVWVNFLCYCMYVTLYNKSLPIWSRLTLVCRSGSLSCGMRGMSCFLYRCDSLNALKAVILRIGFQKRGFKAKTLLRRGLQSCRLCSSTKLKCIFSAYSSIPDLCVFVWRRKNSRKTAGIWLRDRQD